MAAGAAGAVCRYLIDAQISARVRHPFPFGILWVNVSGSLVLGLLTGVVLFRGGATSLTAVAGTGFCGGYTTFSSFTVESIRLVEQRRYATALTYLIASALAGLAAAAFGLLVSRWI